MINIKYDYYDNFHGLHDNFFFPPQINLLMFLGKKNIDFRKIIITT